MERRPDSLYSRILGRATSTPLHRGATTIVVETSVRDATGKLVAKVTQTQLVLRPRR